MSDDIPEEVLKFGAVASFLEAEIKDIGGCGNMRFALVVWCDCAEEVTYSATNERNCPRAMKMLRETADALANARTILETAGHA